MFEGVKESILSVLTDKRESPARQEAVTPQALICRAFLVLLSYPYINWAVPIAWWALLI